VLQISSRCAVKEGDLPYLHVSVLSWYLLWCWNRRNSESFTMASASKKTTPPSSSPCCPSVDSPRLAVAATSAVVQSDRVPNNSVALIRPLDSLPEPSTTNAPSAKGITT
jgi:hypothetical protein